MSQKHKFVKRAKIVTWENREIEIELPFYGIYYLDYGMVYVKIDEQLREFSITINDECITDSGRKQNLSIEIESEKQHSGNYSFDFYLNEGCNPEEYRRAITQALELIEKAKS